MFLGCLLGLFKLSRRGIPFLEDGYYESETEAWLLYEYYEIYYVLFPYFAGFFSVFLDTKPRHQAFGCKIGKNTIVGNGRLFNPERTIIGDNFSSISGEKTVEIEGEFKKVKNIGTMIGEDCTIESHVVSDPGIIIGRKCKIDPMKRITKNISSNSKVM